MRIRLVYPANKAYFHRSQCLRAAALGLFRPADSRPNLSFIRTLFIRCLESFRNMFERVFLWELFEVWALLLFWRGYYVYITGYKNNFTMWYFSSMGFEYGLNVFRTEKYIFTSCWLAITCMHMSLEYINCKIKSLVGKYLQYTHVPINE